MKFIVTLFCSHIYIYFGFVLKTGFLCITSLAVLELTLASNSPRFASLCLPNALIKGQHFFFFVWRNVLGDDHMDAKNIYVNRLAISQKRQPDVSWYNATEQKVTRVASCQTIPSTHLDRTFTGNIKKKAHAYHHRREAISKLKNVRNSTGQFLQQMNGDKEKVGKTTINEKTN